MDKSLVTIEYVTADGSRIFVEVSIQVKELLEQSNRQIQGQRRQDRRHIDYMDFMNGSADAAIIDPQADIANYFIKMESYNRLYTAMDQLPVVQRRRLHMHFIHNLTYRQIAELESTDQAAIGRSIQRALSKLQKYLTD